MPRVRPSCLRSIPDNLVKYYVYKTTFKDLPGYFYYGKKKDDGKPYFGSPKTWRCLWDQFEPEVQILQWYETEEEAAEAENSLIGHTWKQQWGEHKYSLNENRGGVFKESTCSENGKRSIGKIQNHPDSPSWRKRGGEVSGKMKTSAQQKARRTSGLNNARAMNGHPNTKANKERNVRKMLNHPNTVSNREEVIKRQSIKVRVTNLKTGEVTEYKSVNELSKVKKIHKRVLGRLKEEGGGEYKGYKYEFQVWTNK